MSSLAKTESSQSGRTYLKEIGKTVYTWNIEDFKDLVEIGKSIKSPDFTIEATKPSGGSAKVVSFCLEMQGSGKSFNVRLVKVSGYGNDVVKVAKIIIPRCTHNPDVTLTSPTTFEILHTGGGKQFFKLNFASENLLPVDLTVKLEISLRQEMKE